MAGPKGIQYALRIVKTGLLRRAWFFWAENDSAAKEYAREHLAGIGFSDSETATLLRDDTAIDWRE